MFEWLFKYPIELYREGELRLAHAPRVEVVLLILAGVAAGSWWLYSREQRLKNPRRWLLFGLRVSGMAAVLLALAGPVLKLHKRDAANGVICVGIDVSKSMTFSSNTGGQSRFESARRLLAGKDGIPERLAAAGDVRLFAFGNNTRQIHAQDLDALVPADDNTLLASAIKEMQQSARGLPVEALIVLTDGVDTTSSDPAVPAAFAASRGASVHAIGFGVRSDAPDIEVLAVNAPARAQLASVVQASVIVRRGNYDGPLEMRVFDDLVLLKTEPVPASPTGAPVTVDLRFVLEKKGTAHLSVEIPPVPGETVVENNKRSFQIEVEETRVEVLLVEGSPRHEYAFLRRAMWDNPSFRIVTLLRLGKGRFYQSQNDDSLLTRDFPSSAEDLGRFKAIILSDIEASFFNAAQMAAIVDFVRNRGGGLLMLGGVNAFNLGGYDKSPLADLLPVTLAPDSVAPAFEDSEFTFQVSKDGAEHEILRLTPDAAENLSQWALMPKLRGYNPLFRAKPGARVLAVKSGDEPDGKKPVLLAAQDVGAGRCAIFAPANSWRWRMGRSHDDDSYRRFWTQMLRWLAVGSKEMLTVSTGTTVANLRQPVSIGAQVLDKAHRPLNDAQVVAQVKDPFGNVEELPLTWILNEDGIYQAIYRPVEKGEYVVNVVANAGGTKLEKSVSFSAIESSVEFAHPSLDAETLARIAQAGKGTVDLNGNADKAIEAILASASKKQKLLDVVEERDLRDAPGCCC